MNVKEKNHNFEDYTFGIKIKFNIIQVIGGETIIVPQPMVIVILLKKTS